MTQPPSLPDAVPARVPGRVPARVPGWATLALLLTALLAPSGILANSWCLDDVPVVQRNEGVARGLGGVARLVRRPAWPGELEEQPWRPLALVSLALDHPGGAPLPSRATPLRAHVVNLVLHALAAWLLLGLMRRLVPGRPALAWGTALVFAVHPLAVGALTLATGRSVVLGLVLGLLALRSVLAWRPQRPALLPLVTVAGFLALLACEAFVGLPLLALALDALVQRQSPLAVLRQRWPAHLALLLGALLWLLLWPGPGRPPVHVPPPEALERLALGSEALARGVLKVLVPTGWSADRSVEAQGSAGYALTGLRAAVTAAGAALLLLCVLLPARRGGRGALRAAALGAGLVLVPAALTLPHGAALEDRWSYAALPALAALGGLLVEWLWMRGRALALVGVVVLLGALGVLGQRLARDYRNDEQVLSLLLDRPTGHGPALLRHAEGLLRRAEDDVARAYRMRPHTPEFIALESAAQRARAKARELLTLAARTQSTSGDARVWLGLAQLDLLGSTPSQALEKLLHARRLDPLLSPPPDSEALTQRRRGDPRALRQTARLQAAIGFAHQIQGHTGLAADSYRDAARLEREAAQRSGVPGQASLLQRAALALLADGAFGEALSMLEDLALTADDVLVRKDIQQRLPGLRQEAAELLERLLQDARGFYDSNHNKAAVETYEQALRVDPVCVEAVYWAARLRGKYFGSYELALGYVEDALARLAARTTGATLEADRRKLETLREELQRWRAKDEDETQRGD